MKAVLVFSPFCLDLPTYVPMGIASLKSYIESKSKHKVKYFDFNLEFFQREFLDTRRDVCISCKISKSKCVNFAEMQFIRKHRNFVRSLLVSLRENKDFRIKCNLRRLISDLYANVRFCYMMNMDYFMEENMHYNLNKMLRFYVNKIISKDPKVIGFSVFTFEQKRFSLALARLLKKIYNKKIVFGGHVIGLMSYKEKNLFLKKNTFVDYLVEKEGEDALLALLDGESLEKVPNLIYRRKGHIKTNFNIGVKDINQLPPSNYTDFKINEYVLPKPVLLLSTSKNCPWNKCIFCSTCLVFNKGFRQKDTVFVIHDIKVLISKYKINTFFFADPCISVTYVQKLIIEIKKAKINIRYGLMMRCEKELKDNELVAQLYNSGCRYIVFGVETLNPRISKIINKGIDVNDVEGILLNCKKHNIYCHIAIIFGLPTQTFGDMKREVAKLRRLCNKTDFHCEIIDLMIEKGTIIDKNFEKYRNVTIGKGSLVSDSVKLTEFRERAFNNLNKHRTLKLAYFDDIFLTSINSLRNR